MQKSVNLVVKKGFDGQKVTTDQNIYTCENYLSDGTVKAGTFAFKGSASGNGEQFGVVSATGSALVGFVERVVDASIAPTVEATDVYPAGFPVLVALKGQFYVTAHVTANATVSAGMLVLVDGDTGAITFASQTSEGLIDTGFKVVIPDGKTSAGNGDVIVIEKF